MFPIKQRDLYSGEPLLHTMQTVQHMPDTLRLYQTERSRFWQMQAFLKGKMVVRSNRTGNLGVAQDAAKRFYGELLVKSMTDQPLTHSQANFKTADGKKYLLITARSEKKVSHVPSLAAAVTIYERIKGEPGEHEFFKRRLSAQRIAPKPLFDIYSRATPRGQCPKTGVAVPESQRTPSYLCNNPCTDTKKETAFCEDLSCRPR